MDEISLEQRAQGSLLGLAVGDALGTTLEFKYPGTFEPITDIVGGGPFFLEPGEWTDDTSMALCLAASLIETKEFDLVDQLERYERWRSEGYFSSTGKCFDIGQTVSRALSTFAATKSPYSGPTEERSAGNGSLMRLAPVPIFFNQNSKKAIEMSGESSRTTHGNAMAVDACRYFGGLIVASLNGTSKEKLLSPLYSPIEGYWKEHPLNEKIHKIACGSFKEKDPPDIRGTGFVVDSLEAALWAFNKSHSFKEGALLAVNLGDDADTTGAIYGQIAGSYYGVQGIPEEWRALITEKGLIISMAKKLLDLSSRINS